MTTLLHDPDAVLDYTSDWSAWLTARGSDTITAATATITKGTATVGTVTFDDTTVTFWISGAALGNLYVNVHITTAAGRQDDRTVSLFVKER